ncbi:glycosyltransferase family 9 protein [Bordetella flabilis]|uniref:ADP-heptose--LPS heptosyltransferase n=1 Tax=Bordetella flabilis TaxID=463014 RepID=A0A193G8P4_9BORD|nr:glycosyltransferase family 9 protein [Bordetella flabilis]ANN76033.1 hypothetical protein BAU07_01855 [Bordetella flabilis]
MPKPSGEMPPYDRSKALRGLRAAGRVALLMAPRLGDTLLMMTLAQNLALHGRQVTVFGDYAQTLKDWFPSMDVQPSLAACDAPRVLAQYDCAAQMHIGWPYTLHDCHSNYFYYDAHVVVTGRGFVKLFQIRDFCRDELDLPAATTDNGLQPLNRHEHRCHPERIILHPTSTEALRCWAPRHFEDLGRRLLKAGYEPNFLVAPQERADWTFLIDAGLKVPQLPSLSEVASLIHASGWFIGNESGLGHLASNLGVPTLSVTGRPTRTKAWRPAWATSRIVYPAYIPGGRWRDRLWRQLLLPGSVMSAFRRLQQDDRRNPVLPPWTAA